MTLPVKIRGPKHQNFGAISDNFVMMMANISGIQDIINQNKKAKLSQRRPRDAPNIRVPWKISRVLTTPTATFPEICNGLLFRSILWMCVQNLKFVALPVPEIIGNQVDEGRKTGKGLPVSNHLEHPWAYKSFIAWFLADRTYCYTVWSAIGIILSSVCLSVTLCILTLRVGVQS